MVETVNVELILSLFMIELAAIRVDPSTVENNTVETVSVELILAALTTEFAENNVDPDAVE